MKWIAWAFAFRFVVLGGQGEAPLALSPLGELTVAEFAENFNRQADYVGADLGG